MILLDEQLTGLLSFLQSLGWEVTTVNKVGLVGRPDNEILEYVKGNNLILITEDSQLAQLANLHKLKHIWLNSARIADLLDNELRKIVNV